MRNDLFTHVASLSLLVDAWAPYVSFVFNLQPWMGAGHLQLHLTPPALGWEPGTSSFVIPLWLPSSRGRRARHRARSRWRSSYGKEGAGGSQPRVQARLSGGVLRLRWKTPLQPWIGAEMWIGSRGWSLRRQRRRQGGESCCVCGDR